jgi:hypothetical protein
MFRFDTEECNHSVVSEKQLNVRHDQKDKFLNIIALFILVLRKLRNIWVHESLYIKGKRVIWDEDKSSRCNGFFVTESLFYNAEQQRSLEYHLGNSF